MGRGIGWGTVAAAVVVVWVVAQSETENPGATNRATNSGANVIAGAVGDAGTILDQVRAEAGGLASDLGGAVEGQSEGLSGQPLVPLQVQPEEPQG